MEEALVKILSSPNHSNKSWITNQYDQSVMCDTAQKSGSDAAIIRINGKVDASTKTIQAFIQVNGKDLKENETRLCITRYGNVMGSRGSVIPFFDISSINARSSFGLGVGFFHCVKSCTGICCINSFILICVYDMISNAVFHCLFCG